MAARTRLILATALMLAGCVTLPLGTTGGIDPAAAAQLSREVPLYDPTKLSPDSYIRVGSLSASSCDNAFLGGPGQEAVVMMVRQKAQAMGANGITDLSCGHGASNEAAGCFSSTTCSATALKVVPPASSDAN